MQNMKVNWRRGLPKDVLAVLPQGLLETGADAHVVGWFLGEGRLQPAVMRYIAFLKSMSEAFSGVAEMFDHWSPAGSAGKKDCLRLTNPEEILFIANHLYVLDSFGVTGDVLECGCAHGFSSVCLSLACQRLGRRLYVADSFEGLPVTRADEPFFHTGDYAAREDEVLHHIDLMGCRGVVTTVKGWYSESLRSWSRPIAVLWMDVDLYESARDLLAHVFTKVEPTGAIFTHEYTDFYGVVHQAGTMTVPGALHERFRAEGIAPQEAKLARYWGVFGGPHALQLSTHTVLDALLPELQRLDVRARQLEALRNSRTVRTAFALRKLLPF